MNRRTPKPYLLREQEGDTTHGKGASGRGPVEHPISAPDKPSWLSPEACEIWDDYIRFCAPGLLRLVHAPGLAQLCEDKVLEYRLRRGLQAREEVILRNVESRLKAEEEAGKTSDSRDVLPGGPLVSIAMEEEGKRLFGVLNQIILRVQRQEQQFGLTPQSATKVDIGKAPSADNAFEDELCG